MAGMRGDGCHERYTPYLMDLMGIKIEDIPDMVKLKQFQID